MCVEFTDFATDELEKVKTAGHHEHAVCCEVEYRLLPLTSLQSFTILKIYINILQTEFLKSFFLSLSFSL